MLGDVLSSFKVSPQYTLLTLIDLSPFSVYSSSIKTLLSHLSPTDKIFLSPVLSSSISFAFNNSYLPPPPLAVIPLLLTNLLPRPTLSSVLSSSISFAADNTELTVVVVCAALFNAFSVVIIISFSHSRTNTFSHFPVHPSLMSFFLPHTHSLTLPFTHHPSCISHIHH